MKEAVRAFILSRARDVFQEKGFANATVDDIAAAAGVSKPTLYNYFSGKQGIFMAVLEDLHARVAELIRPHIGNFREDFPLRLRKMSVEVAKNFFRQQGLVRIMLSERRLIVELFDQCGKNDNGSKPPFWQGETYLAFVAFFQFAVEAGELNRCCKPELLASIYIGMMTQINLNQMFHTWSENEYMNAVQTAVDVLCNGLLNKIQ
ncbi:MAG TPA: TetR/AcrR family transcriptional regulator [Candidatus Aminicenantes bacterium]|nr:TetR/AcrR family transcriptional regulator [Candidatus Aminicenantes bacterium]